MNTGGGRSLRTLNAITPLQFPFHFCLSRGGASLLRSLHFTTTRFKKQLLLPSLSFSQQRLSPLCSLAEGGNGNSLPLGLGEGINEVSRHKLLQVVLVSPQIPGNTGCIARTCAATAVGLHLVEPLGFQIDDTKLKRAGLDFWPYVVVKVHDSWAEFQDYFRQQEGDKRLLAFTKRGTTTHSDFSYRKGDYLILGSETCGLPPDALVDCKSKTFGGGTIRIPMIETYVRCLNLSVSAGMYEASRQLNYEQLQIPLENCTNSEHSFVSLCSRVGFASLSINSSFKIFNICSRSCIDQTTINHASV